MKKVTTGRKSSYDPSRFLSSSRDALQKEDDPSQRSGYIPSSGDAHSRKDAKHLGASHHYRTRSVTTKTASRKQTFSAASSAAGLERDSAVSLQDGGTTSDNFQHADEHRTALPDCMVDSDSAFIVKSSEAAPIIGCGEDLPVNTEVYSTNAIPASTDDSADEYNFSAVVETPPQDSCLARDCFNPALNQSADDYVAMRERRRLRNLQLDMLMGTLGVANQDEIISVADIREFTETRIAAFGVNSVSFFSTQSEVEVVTDGSLAFSDIFPLTDLPKTDETLILNGTITPYPTPREGQEYYPISNGLHDNTCTLCASGDSLHHFRSRHRKENLKHVLAHGREPDGPKEEIGDVHETEFSANATLLSSSYDRQINFLPVAADMQEAVEIIRTDDSIPASQLLDDFEIIESGIRCIAGLSLPELLKFYYCIVNSTYDIRGDSIRHVQVCRSKFPAP